MGRYQTSGYKEGRKEAQPDRSSDPFEVFEYTPLLKNVCKDSDTVNTGAHQGRRLLTSGKTLALNAAAKDDKKPGSTNTSNK